MNQKDYENKYPNNKLGRKQYDAALDGDGNDGKGLHIYESPYLWEENNVVIEWDNPTENFVPTPTINAGDERAPLKKAMKIGLLVGVVLFMIYAFIAILLESPDVFGFQQGVGGFW